MHFRACGLATAIVLLLYPQSGGAAGTVSVQYTLVPMGGNVYRCVYSITNNGSLPGSAPIKLFDILFDPTLYQESSLQIVTSQVNSALNSQWNQQLLVSVPGLPADYDALAINGNLGIQPGTTVTGFAIQFTWIGPGSPGSQPFLIYDPTQTPYAQLQSGQTSTSVPAGVPVSSNLTLLLIACGIALAATYQLRINRRTRDQAETATRS